MESTNGCTRNVYLSGSRRGEVRRSRRVRARQHGQSKLSRSSRADEKVAVMRDGLSANEDREEPGRKRYGLGSGYRDSREGITRFDVGCEEEQNDDGFQGTIVGLDVDEVCSGRAWFRVPFPDRWMREYTKEEREQKALREAYDYGKEFVRYDGRWHEASEVK